MADTLVSVLCPSRGRPDTLMASATGLMDLAAGDVEFLTAADPDDTETQETGRCLDRLWVAPERYGYARLHEYYNHLAAMATGEWLLMWNDDAVMETPGWDEIIAAQDAPAVLWPYCPQAAGMNVFPAWPAGWARHLGHVSLHHSADVWVQETGERTGRTRHIPVRVTHLCVTDQTAQERGFTGDFYGPPMAAARERDAASLRELLKDAPPANARLVSVIAGEPRQDLSECLAELLRLAADAANVEFLVAGEGFRQELEYAGIMGYGEVHSHGSNLERWAHGRWQVRLEDIPVAASWDDAVRQ